MGNPLFTGWLALGSAISGTGIAELTDANYVRGQVSFSPLSGLEDSYNVAGTTLNTTAGFAGPVSIGAMGLFTAATGGACFVYWSLTGEGAAAPSQRAPGFPVGAFAAGAGLYLFGGASHLKINNASAILSEGSRGFQPGDVIGLHNRVDQVFAGSRMFVSA